MVLEPAFTGVPIARSRDVMIARIAIGMLAACVMGFAADRARAQTIAGIIEGRIVDATGAPLADATVEARGAQAPFTALTDAAGAYRLAPLAPGLYTVTASRAGFRAMQIEAVEVPVNRTVTLDFRLELAPQREALTVRADPPLLDRAAAFRQRIEDEVIRSIPLNGRNYLDLLKLTPGVTINEIASSPLSNRDTRGAILGERAGNSAFLVDGIDNNDDFRGGAFQDVSQDAVQEFEVLATGFSAEFGGGSGAVVNVVTRSGANRLGGAGYLFLRDSALDASNVEGEDAPELSRQNYGFTIGGPIARDRAWYFGSVEHILEEREALFVPNIPERLLATEDFSRLPRQDEVRLFGKYTGRLAPAHDLRAQANWTRTDSRNRLSGPTSLPSASDDTLARTFVSSASLTSVRGASAVFDTSAALRTQAYDINQDRAGDRSYTALLVDEGAAFEFGPRLGSVEALEQRYLSLRETVSVSRWPRHAAKLGAEYTHTRVDGENAQGLLYFIGTTRANFERFGLDSFQIPQGVAFLADQDRFTRLRNHGVALFAQDDWHVSSSVAVNAGLRWDYDSRFDDPGNLAPRLGVVWTPDPDTVVRGSWGRFYDRYRLGVAQAVPELGGFNGRTIVEIDYPRLAADAVAGPLPGLARLLGDPFFLHRPFGIPFEAVVRQDTVQALTGLTPAAFLAALNAFVAAAPARVPPFEFSPITGFLRHDQSGAFQDAVKVARPFRTPHNDTLAIGLQRRLGRDLSASATYVHRRIDDILGVRITNLSPAARTIGAPITTDGGPLLRSYGPWYDGTYDAFIASVEKPFGGTLGLQANYTYARSTDNLLNANLGIGVGAQGGAALPTDNLDLEADRGNSTLSVPHTFVASGQLAVPYGFQVSGVLRLTSGAYFSATGTPVDVDGDGIRSTRPPGTRRNGFRGPATRNLDLRVERRFGLGGRARASALVELFNLTNARNPRQIDTGYVAGAPVATFGDTIVPLPGREAQIGLRLEF
jgi:hypothetical protein